MIIIKDISVDFGGKKIFSKINFMVNKGDKIGLVGDNGVGKSTLLKVIYNDDGYYSGSINYQKNIGGAMGPSFNRLTLILLLILC